MAKILGILLIILAPLLIIALVIGRKLEENTEIRAERDKIIRDGVHVLKQRALNSLRIIRAGREE